MEVTYAFLCETAEYKIPGTFESINATGICSNCHSTVPGFPCKTTFSLVVCWHPGEPGEPDDTDGYLYVNFLDPNFKKLSYVLRTKPEYKITPDAEPKVKYKGLLILPIKDLPLEIPGKYTIDLSYGGKSKWTTFMTIQEAQKDM